MWPIILAEVMEEEIHTTEVDDIPEPERVTIRCVPASMTQSVNI
jgi:hypothetical protein